jgi:hypothetical protein
MMKILFDDDGNIQAVEAKTAGCYRLFLRFSDGIEGIAELRAIETVSLQDSDRDTLSSMVTDN